MDRSDIPFLSAIELSRLIEKREVSPVEATEAYLDRIDALDFKFNAYLTVTRNEALEAAREAERSIAQGNYLGPMHGIPVAPDCGPTSSPTRTPPRSPTSKTRAPSSWARPTSPSSPFQASPSASAPHATRGTWIPSPEAPAAALGPRPPLTSARPPSGRILGALYGSRRPGVAWWATGLPGVW